MEHHDATQVFADFAVGLDYRDLPDEVVARAKQLLLDTVGVIVAASSQAPEHRAIVDLVIEEGGKEESSIIAYGNRVPCYMAAFANGAMAHCLDYDDNAFNAVHVGTAVVPATLASAERAGKVSGKELLCAIVVGSELQCRLALSVLAGTNRACLQKWFLTPLFGVLSAAATSGKILGLGRDQLANALGIACNQAAGIKEMGVGGTLRAFYAAFPGKAGMLSSLLAARGVTTSENSLEGTAGLMAGYFNGQYDRELLTGKLGAEFKCLGIGFKPWPACGSTHVFVESALHLTEQHDIAAEDVEAVKVYTSAYINWKLCQPLEMRRRPPHSIAAKYSIPFTVATAIAKRAVNVGSFTPEALSDARVLAVAEKVVPEVHSDAGRVEIKLRNGKTYSNKVEYSLGSAGKPLSSEHIESKFRDCLAYSIKPLRPGAADKVTGLVRNLEDVDDAAEIVRWLVP
ncbi:MAG: MmgE/PrpD family protein [Chloroflexota bacterium]